MVLGILRGLIKPYYEQGQRSILREEMILAAIEREMDVDAFRDVNMIRAIFMAASKGAGHAKQSAFNSIGKQVITIREMRGFDNASKHKDTKAIQNIVEVFHKLEASGFLDPEENEQEE